MTETLTQGNSKLLVLYMWQEVTMTLQHCGLRKRLGTRFSKNLKFFFC
jgi:hypothetical protein